jgi:hypothetical protein
MHIQQDNLLKDIQLHLSLLAKQAFGSSQSLRESQVRNSHKHQLDLGFVKIQISAYHYLWV